MGTVDGAILQFIGYFIQKNSKIYYQITENQAY